MTSLSLSSVSVSYEEDAVVREVTFRVDEGSSVALIGPNGAGKTSLLRALAGLIPHGGAIELGDQPLGDMSRRQVARTVAYVPQRPVIPESMLVTDYVMLGRTPHISYLGMETSRDRRVVGQVLDRLDLRRLAERPLGSLSGGEVQRAVLARALSQQAPVLLLDEPTAALDVGHQQQVMELIDVLRTEHALTVVSAMHDLTLSGQFAARLLLLAGGQLVAEGPPRAVLTEEAIRRHYGATVRILDDADGRPLVIPTRQAPATEPASEPGGGRQSPVSPPG